MNLFLTTERERTGKEWSCFLPLGILNNKTHRQEGRGTGSRGGPRKEIRWANIWRRLALIFYRTENTARGHQPRWELPRNAAFRGCSSPLLSPRLSPLGKPGVLRVTRNLTCCLEAVSFIFRDSGVFFKQVLLL